MWSLYTCISRHTALHKLSSAFRKEWNNPSVPGINGAITEDSCSVHGHEHPDPASEMHVGIKISVNLFPWEYRFNSFFFFFLTSVGALYNWQTCQRNAACPLFLLFHESSTYMYADPLLSPDPSPIKWDGWGVKDWNGSYLGSYCSTHVVCNLSDPQRLE